MSYQRLINKQIQSALKAIRDLAVDVTLIRTTPSDYDFSSLEPSSDARSTTVVKGVFIKTSRSGKQSSRTETSNGMRNRQGELIVASDGLHDWSGYDRAKVAGVEWLILGYTDDGYIVTLGLGRAS
jgi:hypothetical protein